MNIKSQSNTLVVQHTIHVESVEVGCGSVVCRITRTEKIGKGKESTSVTEHLCRETEVRTVRAGKKIIPALATRKIGKYSADYMLIYNTGLAQLQKEGFGYYPSYLNNSAFTSLTANEGRDVTVVQVDMSRHMLYDIAGNPLPSAMYFGYIEGHIDNKYYDLKKVLGILKQRTDIELLDEKKGISDIPYYNAKRNRNKFIPFRWHASVEDYRKVFAEASKNGRCPHSGSMRNAALELDILGLKVALLPEAPEAVEEERDSDSYEDDDN